MSKYEPQGIKKIYHTTKRFLAKRWLGLFHPIQIGITGSQGKTNTTYTLTTLLGDNVVVTDTNLDTTFNVPITALKVKPSTKYIVWELGIDHPGDMDTHLEIAKPTIGIITGISAVHTDKEHMGSLQNLIAEKRKLIEALPESGVAILNGDDEHVRGMAMYTKAHVLFYGTDAKNNTVWTDNTHVSLNGIQTTIHDGDKKIQLSAGLIGTHQAYNLMAAYLTYKTVNGGNLTDAQIHQFIERAKLLQPLKGRMSAEKGPLGTTLLNDSLRANPTSTNFGLQTLSKIEYNKGKKIAVIGEMGELEKPEEEHAKTGEILAKLQIDFVLCIGPLRKYTVDTAIQQGLAPEKIVFVLDIFAAADKLKEVLKPGDLFYLKGSYLRNYPRIIKLLNGQPICCNAVLCPYSHLLNDSSN